MSRPSSPNASPPRSAVAAHAARPAAGVALAVVAFAGNASAQVGPDPADQFGTEYFVLQAFVFAAITLVIGGLLILLARGYTERVTDVALERPGRAFLWGIGLWLGVVVATVLLAITVVGLLVAIPLLFGFGLFALVAAEFGYLAAGRLVTAEWAAVLAVAVIVSALTGLVPILGSIVALVLSSIGIGAVVVDYRDG